MNKKQLIEKLEEVYSELENMPADSTLHSVNSDIMRIQDRMAELIESITVEGVAEDTESES